MKKIIQAYYPYLPLLLLCIFYGYKAMDFPIHDFSNYYFSGKFLAEGTFNFRIYFPYDFNKAISDLGHENIFANYAPNTPFLAFVFLPFSFFSVEAAKLVFNCISIGLFLFSIYRLFSFYRINPKFALLIPVLFLVAIKSNLLFGQVYFLLFFLLTEGWLAYEQERWKQMAFFWGLGILLKVFPLFLVLMLLFKKQGKALFYLVLSCFLLFGVSLIFTGSDIWIFFFRSVLPKASNGEIATAFVDNYQSVFMFLKRLLVYDSVENPNWGFENHLVFSALILAFKIGFIALGYFITRKSRNHLQMMNFWVLAMILLSPYGSTYTLILLIFPFLALIKSEITTVKKFVFCALFFLIGTIPLSLYIESQFPFSYLRLLLTLLLFVFSLMELQQKINWKSVSVLVLIPMILVLIFKKEGASKSMIVLEESPILIYDYKIENHTEDKHKYLVANFWDGKEKVLFWKQSIQTAESLNLKNNQVFYRDKQLTFDKSNKLKPTLIDNKYILYLSDYDRGIGFYTLRKIELK